MVRFQQSSFTARGKRDRGISSQLGSVDQCIGGPLMDGSVGAILTGQRCLGKLGAFPRVPLGSATSAWHRCQLDVGGAARNADQPVETRLLTTAVPVQLLSSKFTVGHNSKFCICGHTNPVTGLCLGFVRVTQRGFMDNSGVWVTDGEAAEFLDGFCPLPCPVQEKVITHPGRAEEAATSLRARLFPRAKKHPSLRLTVAALRGTNMSGN